MNKLNKGYPSHKTHNGITDGKQSGIEINPDLEKLREYTQSKLALAGQLRIVREELSSLGLEKSGRLCEELVVKLAEDRFTLAVLGQFKRGKSSLMNAIIGRELLPTGVLPLTSAITVLKYGPAERLVVKRANTLFDEELPISSLSDYVTEKGNPWNQKKVQTACVEIPVPFLRRGIEFVDTPGVGSSIMANTATTYGFLPQCDAVLFVTGVDTPMTSLELEFLKEIRLYVDRIFFVINKIDLVNEHKLPEVLAFVSETIKTQIGSAVVNIFPVSARKALNARTFGDAILYEQSGLKALEEALSSFLAGEKSAAFLSAIAQKAMRVVDDEAEQNAFEKTTLQARSIAMHQKDFITIRRDPYAATGAIKQAREKIGKLYKGILSSRIAEETEANPALKTTISSLTSTVAFMKMGTAMDLEVDMQSRGCPVCQHITKVASDFFSQWQYHIAVEEKAQAEFAAELGFCPLHTWQLFAISSPHGASIGFAPLAEEMARQLRKLKKESVNGNKMNYPRRRAAGYQKEIINRPKGRGINPLSASGGLKQLVHNSRNCHVCKLLHLAEVEYIQKISAMINEPDGRSSYLHSQGACLRHLGMLMDTVQTAEIREFLLTNSAQHFEEDAEDMRSYALKYEALRRSLQDSNEVDAYRRAIIRIVGGRGVHVPWAEDGDV